MPDKKHILLYDDKCPMCTFQMRLLSWLDWFKLLRTVPLSEAEKEPRVPAIERADLLEAIHCVTREGRVHRGARALRFVGMRLPLLVPMALILWFPGVIWIAEHIYMWISRNRHLISRLFGCKEACSILPERKR